MKRIMMIIALTVGVVLPLEALVACSVGPSPKSSATVRVAALTFSGGASPAVLSLYKAAMEVNRNNPDLDLKIVTVSPPLSEPGVMLNPLHQGTKAPEEAAKEASDALEEMLNEMRRQQIGVD